MGDLVDGENVWNAGYVEEIDCYREAIITNPQFSSLQLQHHLFDEDMFYVSQNRLKLKSAFIKYNKESVHGFQLSRVSMKQRSIKRCFEFFRRIHQNERERSRSEVDDRFTEESYAYTHRIAERNRRIKLTQQFLALRKLLPQNTKKCDKYSTLSNAIVELNRQKLRIAELEKQNKMLVNEVTQYIFEGYSSLPYGHVEDIGKHPLMASICEEAVVVVEESEIGDERAILHVTLRNIISESKYMDAIVTLVKCLKEMKLRVGRIQCREIETMSPVVELAIERMGGIPRKRGGGNSESYSQSSLSNCS